VEGETDTTKSNPGPEGRDQVGVGVIEVVLDTKVIMVAMVGIEVVVVVA
jgi:hypothetical protein